MKIISLKSTAFFLIISMLFFSCKKNDDAITPAPVEPVQRSTPGVYVLSEGGFGANNTKLAFYNTATSAVIPDFFLQQNPAMTAGLGDTGNDLIIYGSKMFVVLNNSSRVTVLNANTGSFLKNINFVNGAANKFPRYAAGARGKVYVTSSDNTVSVIDTTSLTIVKTIIVGANPEGIAASANFLYVANSGGFNTVPDSTVSLIDLTTETEIRKIKVGVNPNKIGISSSGNVYVSAYGNFGAIPPSVSVINGTTNLVSANLGSSFPYSHVRMSRDTAYFYNNYGGAGTCKVYNTTTASIIRNEFITDGTTVQTPYGINVDPDNGDVYIADAVDYTSAGRVYCYSKAGVRKFSFSTGSGVNPNTTVFKR